MACKPQDPIPDTEGETHEVGSESETAEVADAGLCWLRLELAVDGGYEADVDEGEVVVADAELELSHGLDEGRRFDVSDRSTKLSRDGVRASVRTLYDPQKSKLTSMIQTSGDFPDSSTGILLTRSTQS